MRWGAGGAAIGRLAVQVVKRNTDTVWQCLPRAFVFFGLFLSRKDAAAFPLLPDTFFSLFFFCCGRACNAGNNRHPPQPEVEKIVTKYQKTECRFGMDCQSSICLYKHTPPPEPEPEPAPTLEPDGSGAVAADAGCGNFDIMTSLTSFQFLARCYAPGRRVVRAVLRARDFIMGCADCA